MRLTGIDLMVAGLIWIVMCFVGIAMMSRSVDMFEEAFPPFLRGIGSRRLDPPSSLKAR
jgi:hypothetical protein